MMASSLNPVSFRNDISSWSYAQRIKRAAELATSKNKDANKVKQLAKECLKQNTDSSSAHLSFTATETAQGSAANDDGDDDDDGDDWEMVVSGQKTNTAKHYSDHQVGVIIAQCINDTDLLLEALFSPSELLKPMVIKHIARLASDDELYNLITGATPTPLPTVTIDLLHQGCITRRRVNVLDRLALAQWRGIEAVNGWVYACSADVVRSHLLAIIPVYPNTSNGVAHSLNLKFGRLVRFHPLTLVELLERDLATTGSAQPINMSWQEAKRPVSYANDEEKQKQVDRVLTDRTNIWDKWFIWTGSYTREWIIKATEPMLDIMEKWPLAEWDLASERRSKKYRGDKVMVFHFYPYLLDDDNLSVFIAHNFERTRNLILRKLSQQYINNPSFIETQPWQKDILKHLSFTQLITTANDLVPFLAAPLPSGDKDLYDYRRANLLTWTTKVFISSLEGRTREQWLALLRWTSDMVQNQSANDFDESTFFLRACERLVKLSGANDELEISTEAREKRFAKYQKMMEELLELLVRRWSLAAAREKKQQDHSTRNQPKKPEGIEIEHIDIFIKHASSVFTILINMPALALRFHTTAFEVLARLIQTTAEAEKVLKFGATVVRKLTNLLNFSKRKERSAITQEEVDTVCHKYLNLAKEHKIDLSLQSWIEFLMLVVLVGSELLGRYIALETFSIVQWNTLVRENVSDAQKLLCYTLSAAERAALVKSIVMYVEEDGGKNEQISQLSLDALEPLCDLTDPTTQAEMQKKLSTPNITSRVEAWKMLLESAFLSQSGPTLTWVLTLLSGSRMNNEPVMHRELILKPLLVPVSGMTKESNSIPHQPTVFQFYNTYADSLDLHEHARLWLAVFNSVVNARDCPAITRDSLPTIVSNFQEFAWRLVMRYFNETSHPFFTLGLEILWRINVLEYGEKKAGTEESLISSLSVYISFANPSTRWLWSLAYLRDDRFGPQDEPMQQDVEPAIVTTARALIGFFERNVQNFADESGKARETQLVPLVENFLLDDSRRAWVIMPELTAVVERWAAVLRGAPKGSEGLLVWNNDGPYLNMKNEFEAAMEWYNAKVAKKGDPEMHPLMDEFIALAIRSNQASWAVKWWRMWREVRQGAKLNEIVTELLAISPSAIYLDFVVQYLVDHRQDLLDKYILSGETFLDGVFYSSYVAKSNRGLKERSRKPSGRYQRMRARGGATFAAQKISRGSRGSLTEDEDEAIEYILPPTLTGYPRALRFHHRQSIRLGQQVLAIAKNRDATGEERLSGMKRYVHLPTTTYPDLVGLIEEETKLEAAIAEAEKGGPVMPAEKVLPSNIVQELYLGFSHNDEPVAPLEFLLSPAVLKSDKARLAILNLQRVSSYIPASTFHSILKAVLSGERRKALRVSVHKQLIRLLSDNPSDDNVKLILRECNRRYLHRDVRIELLDGAFKWLISTNPDEAHTIDAGWKILERTVAIEDLGPEATAYLLVVNYGYSASSYLIFLPSKSLEIIQNFLAEKQAPSLNLANGELYLTRILLPLVERAVFQDQQDIVYIGIMALRRFMYSTSHSFVNFESGPYDKTLATIREKQQERLLTQPPMSAGPELVSRCTTIAVQYLDWVNRTAGLHAEKPEDRARNWAGVKVVINWFVTFLPDEHMGQLAYESLHNLISVWCTELVGLKLEDYAKRTNLRDYINYYIDAIPVCIPYTFGTQAEVDLMGLVRRVSNPLFDSKLQQREINQFSHKEQTAEEAFSKITSILKRAAEGRFLKNAQKLCADFIGSFYKAKEDTSHEKIIGPEFTSFVNLLIQEKLKSTESLLIYTSSITNLLEGTIKSSGAKSCSVIFTCRDGIRDVLVSLGQTKAGFTQVLEILATFHTFIERNYHQEGFPEHQVGYFQGTNPVVQLLNSVIVSLPEQDFDQSEDKNRSWNQHSALLDLVDSSQAGNILQLLTPSDLSRIINIILAQQHASKGRKAGLRLVIVFNAVQKYHEAMKGKDYARTIVDMVNQLLTDGIIDDRTLQLITMPIKSVDVDNELYDRIDNFEFSLRPPVQTGASLSSFQIDLATTILEQYPLFFILSEPARWLQILVARTQAELQESYYSERGRRAVDGLTKTLVNCLKTLYDYKPRSLEDVARPRFFLAVAQALYSTPLDVASAESGLLKVAGLELISHSMNHFARLHTERALVAKSYNALLAQAYTDTNPYVCNIAWTTEKLNENFK